TADCHIRATVVRKSSRASSRWPSSSSGKCSPGAPPATSLSSSSSVVSRYETSSYAASNVSSSSPSSSASLSVHSGTFHSSSAFASRCTKNRATSCTRSAAGNDDSITSRSQRLASVWNESSPSSSGTESASLSHVISSAELALKLPWRKSASTTWANAEG